uniref:Uncharacterized protein n=1 Tax=Arundo donax TaxID=35708 RepID=A0A0A8ZGF4_ARUDO
MPDDKQDHNICMIEESGPLWHPTKHTKM